MKHWTLWTIAVVTTVSGLPGQVLEPGSRPSGEISGGQTRQYKVALQAGQYAKVAIEQEQVNLRAAVSGPAGFKPFELHGFTNAGVLEAEWIADRPGDYLIQIQPELADAPAGRYTLELAEVEVATERHFSRVAGAHAAEEANVLWSRHDRESVLRAAALLEGSLRHWRAAEDVGAESKALQSIGLAYAEIGEREKAYRAAGEALPLAEASGNADVLAWALNAAGAVHNVLSDRQKAAEFFARALEAMRTASDRAGEAAVLNNLGMAEARMGEKRKALAHFQQSAALYREMQDERRIAPVNSNIGMTYGDLGDYRRALEYYKLALETHRKVGNGAGEAITLNNIGTAHSSLAEYQQALEAHEESVRIHRSLKRNWDVAIGLNNLAWIYSRLGNQERAMQFYGESLAILRTVKDPSTLATTVSNLGAMHADAGDTRKALELYREAQALRREANDRDGEAVTLHNMARCYAKIGEPEKAVESAREAVRILRATGNQRSLASALRTAANVKAGPRRELLDEALTVYRSIRDGRGEADTLADLAQDAKDGGDTEAAHRWAEQALAIMEQLRSSVVSPSLRASFFSTAQKVQEIEVGALMTLDAQRPRSGFGEQALEAAERGRARTLLEILAETGTEIGRDVDTSLIRREGQLQQLIANKAELQSRLLSRKHIDAEATAVAAELQSLGADLDAVQSAIRRASPQYAGLIHPSPLDLAEIQSELLDPDTVLLEYSLGAEQSYLWAVSTDCVDGYVLPARATIEAAARRVYDLLTARNRRVANETPAARAARIRKAEAEYPAAAAEVSRMILGAAAGKIAGKRLLIVADGALQYLPFAALQEPGAAESTPLIVNHEIVTAPSASVLAMVRRAAAGRAPAEKGIAVFADPVFSADDPRLANFPAPVHTASVTGVRGEEFLRLRFSRTEAEAILRLAPGPHSMAALDFAANRAAATDGGLGQYRIVHFATHSLLHDEQPELSGIVLSLVDRRGRPQNGFLRLYDIYNLRLSAELVVLSACRTALGEEISGEGLIGLTRGFLYAGAPRIVATLWEIDDRSTAEVMKRFYEDMLVRGERPAAALRSAQIALWKTRGWDSPYIWAAFTLQGEWR